MILHITKRLGDCLKLGKLPDPPEDFDKFYSWRVNIAQGKRFRLLVFMNDASRYTVFVSKPDKKKDLSEILFETLRGALLADNVNPAVIDRYIKESAGARLYRNLGRKESSWLIRAADNVWFGSRDSKEDSAVTQLASARTVPSYTGADYHDYYRPDEKFYSLLETYGLPVRGGLAFDLKARLDLDGADAIRKLRVSANITFSQLHRVLQKAFSWRNSHLHSFGMFKEWSKNYYAQPEVELVLSKEDLAGNPNARLSANIRLTEYLPQYSKILYSYDFGGDWRHYIEIENVVENCAEKLPILLSGEGDSPPEDVGGIGGFEEFLRIINDPSDDEYEYYVNWAKSQFWKPFDFEEAARDVKRCLN